MKKTDSRSPFVRRDSCQLRIAELDRQLEATLAAKAEARAAMKAIEAECQAAPTMRPPRLEGVAC